ncbi:hypothetical protein LTS18_014703, partial [Coniosporium uncinatum]
MSEPSEAKDPPQLPPTSNRSSQTSYLLYPVKQTFTGLLRRLSTEPNHIDNSPKDTSSHSFDPSESMNGVYTPPRRYQTPVFQPPPLTPLNLSGYKESTRDSTKILSRALAEEIRLLIPPRLQLVENWQIAFSIEEQGVSLATLYKKSDEYSGRRGGFVLVVRDAGGG